MKQYLFLTAVAALLAGCGGGGNDDNRGNDNGQATPMDSFVAFVTDLVGKSDDTTEPVATDAVDATANDTSEPAALM